MNGSVNHPHYNVELQTPEIQKLVHDCSLTGPTFIGQGLSMGCGSDCYGYYITGHKKIGKKDVWGISHANTVMHTCWEEGSEDCSIDMATAKPSKWIVQRGFWSRRGHKTTTPKYWYCDENGNRFAGQSASFYWNGASAYRDPSF